MTDKDVRADTGRSRLVRKFLRPQCRDHCKRKIYSRLFDVTNDFKINKIPKVGYFIIKNKLLSWFRKGQLKGPKSYKRFVGF